MENPFKVGDTVYHVRLGECQVEAVDSSGCPLYLRTKAMKGEWGILQHTSFTPWPEPNHQRPFVPVLKEGDAIIIKVKDGGTPFTVTVFKEDENVVWTSHRKGYLKSKYTFHLVNPEPIKFN